MCFNHFSPFRRIDWPLLLMAKWRWENEQQQIENSNRDKIYPHTYTIFFSSVVAIWFALQWKWYRKYEAKHYIECHGPWCCTVITCDLETASVTMKSGNISPAHIYASRRLFPIIQSWCDSSVWQSIKS